MKAVSAPTFVSCSDLERPAGCRPDPGLMGTQQTWTGGATLTSAGCQESGLATVSGRGRGGRRPETPRGLRCVQHGLSPRQGRVSGTITWLIARRALSRLSFHPADLESHGWGLDGACPSCPRQPVLRVLVGVRPVAQAVAQSENRDRIRATRCS